MSAVSLHGQYGCLEMKISGTELVGACVWDSPTILAVIWSDLKIGLHSLAASVQQAGIARCKL